MRTVVAARWTVAGPVAGRGEVEGVTAGVETAESRRVTNVEVETA